MPNYRVAIRWISFIAFLVFAGPIAASIVGEFFIELAREKGFYAHPSDRLEAAITALNSFVTQTWFLYSAVALSGFLVGLLLDYSLRTKGADKDPGKSTDNSELEIHLQPTYSVNGLDDYRAAIQFLNDARDVRICLDFRVRAENATGWGEWTRVTLLTKNFVAKGEWLYKNIFTVATSGGKRILTIESDNDLDGKRRTIPENSYAHFVLIIFYETDKGPATNRSRFFIDSHWLKPKNWPDVTPEITLTFNGME
jgi:hypothetical protein